MLQSDLHWESPEENRQGISKKLEAAPSDTDLVILPEMFTTGFSMSAKCLSERMDGSTVAWMKSESTKHQLSICGSVIIKADGHFYNRFIWIANGEILNFYDKRHLFRMAEENDVYSAGNQTQLFEFCGWHIMPRVCYDLRFPVWNRSTTVDLQIYVANWPAARISAWDKLLMARAIENQCYVIGVNRIGFDGNNIAYNGHSLAINPRGDALTPMNNSEDGWIMVELDLPSLAAFRDKFPVAMDADKFQLL